MWRGRGFNIATSCLSWYKSRELVHVAELVQAWAGLFKVDIKSVFWTEVLWRAALPQFVQAVPFLSCSAPAVSLVSLLCHQWAAPICR